MDRFGRIDGLVNNVGTSLRGDFEDLTDDDWSSDLQLKLFSARRLIKASLPQLREHGTGAVVNVLSIGAKQQGAGSLPTP